MARRRLLELPNAEDHEVGWHSHPDCWGRGIASEAAAAVHQHAFEAGLPEVLAVTHVGNEACGVPRALTLGQSGRHPERAQGRSGVALHILTDVLVVVRARVFSA